MCGSGGVDWREAGPVGGDAVAVGVGESPSIAEESGAVEAGVDGHDVVDGVVGGGVAGAGDGAAVGGRELRPGGRSAGTVGVGENPDITEGRGTFVAAVDDERIRCGIVDGAGALPHAGSGARRCGAVSSWLGEIVGVAENPNVVEVIILAAEAARK